MLFEDLSLSKSIQRAVFEEGYTNPPPLEVHQQTLQPGRIQPLQATTL